MKAHQFNEKFMPSVVFTESCVMHDALVGEPCWTIPSSVSKINHHAVCGSRIRKAGFNGEIDPRSLSLPVRKNPPPERSKRTPRTETTNDRLQGRYGRFQPTKRR